MNTPELRRSWTRIFAAVAVAVAVTAGFGVWLSAQGGPQPAFGALVLSPPNIVYNTPTNVTFAIKIDTPTLNPTTVQLQKVDVEGNILANLGRLYDDATHGDAVESDKVFTAIVSLNEPTVGKSYFSVLAAFRGDRQNSHSGLYRLDVDPFRLPPDPGEAGKATLEGIDSDGDGARDDVQRWIGLTLTAQLDVRKALLQLGTAEQSFLISSLDRDSLRQVWAKNTAATDCLESVAGRDVATLGSELHALMLNTRIRSQAYFEALRVKGAEVIVLGNDEQLRSNCTF
jgi:hypothetical protein